MKKLHLRKIRNRENTKSFYFTCCCGDRVAVCSTGMLLDQVGKTITCLGCKTEYQIGRNDIGDFYALELENA